MKSKAVKLKKVHYRGSGTVDYVVIGKNCVFSGITSGVISTINAVEDIILAIVQQEQVKPNKLTFFDLQTSRADSSKKPGQFEYDQLKVVVARNPVGETAADQISVIDWEPVKCPARVIKLFAEHIGPKPRQLFLRSASK
jgi:hypothetical protein